MAETTEILRFGSELKDQVDLIAGVSDAQLALLADIREVIRERASLEKDYSVKLLALTRKAQEKKTKRMMGVVLGEEPAKTYTEDTVKSSTLDAAYTQFLTSWEESAALHSTYSGELGLGIAEELRKLEKKKEETKKMQMQFYAKVISERDRIYADRTKMQQKYYDECGEVESARSKQDRSIGHDRHSERAAKQYEQQKTDMLNAKNTYIISNFLANKIKSKLYEADIPDLENQFQDLQANLITRLIQLLNQTQTFTKDHLNTLLTKVDTAHGAINRISIVQDQNLYVAFNLRHFAPPPDWKFEACESYYDKPDINVEPAPKVFLQNKFTRATTKLSEAKALTEAKENDASAAQADIAQETADEKVDKYLDLRHQITFYKTSVALLEKEIEVIQAALGDDIGAQQPHDFKSSVFSIPTTCEYCHSSIWGLSKQGKTCKKCGISVHTRCELKMPAECSGKHGVKTHSRSSLSLSLSKVDSRGESKAIATTPVSSTVVATPSSFTKEPPQPDQPTQHATIVFDFVASSPFEISVDEGTRVKVLEEDDGSGWIKIQNEATEKSGLVPASYLKIITDSDDEDDADLSRESNHQITMPIPIPVAVERSGKYVQAIYSYEAQGDDELGLHAGQRYELTGGEGGGENYGAGWWEGIDPHGKHGIFPSNYVQMM